MNWNLSCFEYLKQDFLNAVTDKVQYLLKNKRALISQSPFVLELYYFFF